MEENTNQKLMETVSFNAEKITNEIEEAITQLEYKIRRAQNDAHRAGSELSKFFLQGEN